METQYLRTLLMVAEEGSFSRAAEKLHLTQSAVSQRTKNLEACCGVQLLDRSRATLSPTVAGQIVIEGARRLLAMEEQMLQQLQELQLLGNRQRLYLCCTAAFGLAHLPAILDRFNRRCGEVEDFKLLFAAPLPALEGLRSGEYDLVVIEHLPDLDFGTLRHMALPEDELLFVSAAGSGLEAGEITLEALQRHCLISRRDNCSCRDLLARNLEAVNSDYTQFPRVMVLDDFNMIIEAALSGRGVTFISRSLVAGYLADGRLQAHRINGFQFLRQRSIVARECEAAASLKHLFMQTVNEFFYGND